MRSEPLELIGSIKEQLTTAASLAAEAYAESAGFMHKGYSEDQINDLLIEDLQKGVMARLRKVGFRNPVRKEEALGVVAKK